ncbi:membrane protein insertase YidC [Fervidibacillus halotolerans]|uniref:Membrane protein insertase YidC n=1 Tax=Fervidibacillus halotolerans TaxID=2980027 RepID=A0A9E8M214_9BACI|nr:membrane protein insertase YidC [Fervidibacillus halotolerans]WAA13460.1 membrane protein insertase YidC [Fervidibacillus halotolerans]
MRKKLLLFITLTLGVFLLSGCASAETEGEFFHDYFVYPFSFLIRTLGNIFNNNYGLAIIAITLIVRTALLPLALRMAAKQKVMREKMEIIKPEMEAIQKQIKAAKTKEEQMKAQQEMMQLYQKHNFNPFSIGCLPALLQIPIWMGLYYAIRITPEIAEHSFLWFNLGETDLVLAGLAAVAYYFQFKVSMFNMPPEQQQQMKIMALFSPVMILIASLSTASALALYWVVSGLFLIGQTYLTKKLYGPVPQAVGNAKGMKDTSGLSKKK